MGRFPFCLFLENWGNNSSSLLQGLILRSICHQKTAYQWKKNISKILPRIINGELIVIIVNNIPKKSNTIPLQSIISSNPQYRKLYYLHIIRILMISPILRMTYLLDSFSFAECLGFNVVRVVYTMVYHYENWFNLFELADQF